MMVSTMWVILLLIGILVALFIGYAVGKKSKIDTRHKKRIEEYEFYPFKVNDNGVVEFSHTLFNEAVDFLRKNRNSYASKQLIIIGEQNIVRDILSTSHLNNYLKIYKRYTTPRRN